ncbi:uncharacterized protein LAESUDRAFT_693406 [Laetiporus sulphureus 93-53]|uniref:Uncharacterized protein n=1 Tax=Laetiporus sulphureus 93-53 TaxID=1314785 RepID=A0A165GX43_9APHY|nr:uncharacterized protein LAESUDRAFT_693406 [Laetiporus sulphureus 93-53]KZT10948.1 hypothetical protein LAESUDRAFT_693406 [Laetiporus sulphureus 93-53]
MAECVAPSAADLWLERSRFSGFTLAAVSYGAYFIMTIQAFIAVHRGNGGSRTRRGRIALQTWKTCIAMTTDRRTIIQAYIGITFVLATLGFAGNAKYSEMIWIDLRNKDGGPAALIEDELDFWINRMTLSCYYVMEWFMQALLVNRCIIIWNRQLVVSLSMCILLLANIAMSIIVLVKANGAVFYDINVQLAYLCISVGINILYTFLVTYRLLRIRHAIRAALGPEHSATYTSVVSMLVESAALYYVLAVVYIVPFAVHSYVSNLILLGISHVQAIAQLLIILRVAAGRAFSHEVTSAVTQTRVDRPAFVHVHEITTTDTPVHLPELPPSSFMLSRVASSKRELHLDTLDTHKAED